MVVSTTSLIFTTQIDQNLWAPGAAIELGIDTGDLFIFDPDEVTYDIDIGGSFLGFEAELFFDFKFGLLAYAEIGNAGSFNGGLNLLVNAEHQAIVTDDGNPISFDFNNFTILSSTLSSEGFSVGAQAGLDLVIGAELGFRNLEFALFGFKDTAKAFTILEIEDKRIPLFSVSPFDTELPIDLGFGLELTLRVPSGADTTGASFGSAVVSSDGVGDPFIELQADVDELILELLGKIPFPPLAAVVKVLQNSVFATLEFDIADYVPAIGEGLFSVEATVVDIGANIGAGVSEDLTLDFTDPETGIPNVDIVLRSDNGTPDNLSDDITVNAKLGDTNVEIDGPTFGGAGFVNVEATYSLAGARFSHGIGIDVTGAFTIDILKAETAGLIGEKLGLTIGPLIGLEFPEGGFRVSLLDDIYTNSFDVAGSAFNTVTDNYEIYYSEFLPTGIDVSKPGQVQRLIAFNEELTLNAAATAAVFDDITGSRSSVSFNAGEAQNTVGTAEKILWAFQSVVANIDADTNLSINERDIIGIDALNTTGVGSGPLEAQLFRADGIPGFPAGTGIPFGEVTAENAADAAGLALLAALPSQADITSLGDSNRTGSADGTHIVYRFNNGLFEIGNNTLGRIVRVDGSVNINGSNAPDALVYFGDEGQLFDGNGENGFAPTGDAFIANFGVNHADDAIELDLLPISQGGDGLFKLSRGAPVRTVGPLDFDLVDGFTTSATSAISGTTQPAVLGEFANVSEGLYTIRIKIRDEDVGTNGFDVRINYFDEAIADETLGSFTANEPERSDVNGVREIVIRDVAIDSSLDFILISGTDLDGGEALEVLELQIFEQHNVTLRDIESFVLATGDKDDIIRTGVNQDLIQFNGGEDTLFLTADVFSEFMDLGAGADVALVEIGDQNDGDSADDIDTVYGQQGADEVIIRNVAANNGLLWSTFGPDPSTPDTATLTTPRIGADASFDEISLLLRSLDVIRVSRVSVDNGTAAGSLPSEHIEITADTGFSNTGVLLADVEAVSFEGNDGSSDLAVFYGGTYYRGGSGSQDTFAADFSNYSFAAGFEEGIVLNGFHDGGDPNAVSPFPDAPGIIQVDLALDVEATSDFEFKDGEVIRTTTIEDFERFIVTATPFDDILIGGAFMDQFFGGLGDDVLVGGGSSTALGTGGLFSGNELSGDGGNDIFFARGDERNSIDGGADTDLLVFEPGDIENQTSNVIGLSHIIETLAQPSGTDFTFAIATQTGNELLAAIDAIQSPDLFSRRMGFDDDGDFITRFTDIEATNQTGLDSQDDVLLFDGGATYLGGERAGDADVFVADLSAQTFGLTWDIEADVAGRNIGNGAFVAGVDRLAIRLGSGSDLVVGGALDDLIYGGDGGDILRGGGAVLGDSLFGGAGADVFAWNANDGILVVDGGSDAGDTDTVIRDTLLVSAIDDAGASLTTTGVGLGLSVMASSSGNNLDVDATSLGRDLSNLLINLDDAQITITAGPSNFVDLINIEAIDVQGSNEEDDLIAYRGGRFYDGGDREGDRDVFVADFFDETRSLTLVARAGSDRVDDDEVFRDIGNGAVIGNFERLIVNGGLGDDFLLGGEFDDDLAGGPGRDILSGGLGNDSVDGGSDDDLLFYEGGIDRFRGGAGNDLLELGPVAGGYKSIQVTQNEFEPGGFVELQFLGKAPAVQSIIVPLLDSIESGATPFIRLQGPGGVNPGSGQFQGTDEASFFTNDIETVVISAGDDDDLLISGTLGGTLSGDGGNDLLISRNGSDILIGGDGFDRYVFKDAFGRDVIGGEIAGDGELFFLGYDRADLTLTATAFDGPDIDDLLIHDATFDNEVVFLNYFASGPNGLDYTFVFDNQNSTLDLTGVGAQVSGAIPAGQVFFGTPGRDTLLQSTVGADSYFALGGNDLVLGSAGSDIIDGGLGIDAVVYENSPVGPGNTGIQIDLSFGFGFGGHATGDILISIEDVLGSIGDDLIDGNIKANALAGGQGNDQIFGADGDDFISGDTGNDILDGGDGDDTVFGGSGNDSVFEGEGDDYLSLGAGNDSIEAGAGNDTVLGGSGDDTALLEAGNDTFMILTNEFGVFADLGSDSVDGGTGNDIIDLSLLDAAVTIDLGGTADVRSNGENDTTPPGAVTILAQLTNFEDIIGTGLDDDIRGDASDNRINSLGGDDTIVGQAGNDTLIGGSGFDQLRYDLETGGESILVDLFAGTGNDSFGNIDTLAEIEHIFGGTSYVNPGSAFDDLIGDDRDNRFTGNAGVDVDFIDGNGGIDTIDYGSEVGPQAFGVSVDLSVAGSFQSPNATDTFGHGDLLEEIENVIGSVNGDTITGSDGDNLFVGGDGVDTLSGGLGFDIVDYSQETGSGGIVIDTTGLVFTNSDSFGNADVLSEIEGIVGTSQDDVVVLDAISQQVIYGGEGDDVLLVFGSDRTSEIHSLFGGAGNDSLSGASGFEVLAGGSGNDTISGGGGDDIYLYTGGFDVFEGVFGTAFGVDEINFLLFGSAIIANLETSNDVFTSDTADAGTGTLRQIMDIIGVDAVAGSEFNDTITGNGDDNRLFGNVGNDTLQALAGDDFIDGGAGIDTLIFFDAGSGISIDFSQAGNNAVDSFGNTDSVTSIERVFGTAQADSFTGGIGDETFVGGDGVDSFDGGDGFDTIDLSLETGANSTEANFTTGFLRDSFGNSESFANIERIIGSNGAFDDLFGGAGNDTLTGNAGASVDLLDGNGGIDTVDYSLETGSGGAVANLSAASPGLSNPNAVDTFGDSDAILNVENLIGSRNNDVFTGSAVSNTLLGNLGNDLLTGEAGADMIDGGAGIDSVDYSVESGGGAVEVDLRRIGGHATDTFGDTDTLLNVEIITATGLGDTVIGADSDNMLVGLGGNDTLDGWAGDDGLFGDAGNDILLGWEGDDSLFGGAGDDSIAGEQDDDTLSGGIGNDTLDGGDGSDTADYSASVGAVTVFLGSFASGGDATGDSLISIENVVGSGDDDVIFGDLAANVFTGGAGRDYLSGAAGNDTLFGGDDADVLESGAGNDTLDGGDGQDLLSAFDAISAVTIDLANMTSSSADYAGDVLTSIEGILGSGSQINVLRGAGDGDLLIGGNQDDRLIGRDGADVLLGQGGDDLIVGGNDADVLLTGFGNDTVTTGTGADVILFALNEANGEGDDIITDFELGVDLIVFYGTGFATENVSVGTAAGSSNALLSYASSSVELQGITEAEVNSNFVFVGA